MKNKILIGILLLVVMMTGVSCTKSAKNAEESAAKDVITTEESSISTDVLTVQESEELQGTDDVDSIDTEKSEEVQEADDTNADESEQIEEPAQEEQFIGEE
ncbi:MAG: hypothetical protein IJM37_11255 [Lachnospiraceae bacterium]|nr:hypothetical protein [Lachnospiraceae bacterium]